MQRYTITDTRSGVVIASDARSFDALEAMLDHFPERHADDAVGYAVNAVAFAMDEERIPAQDDCDVLNLSVSVYDDGKPDPWPVIRVEFIDTPPPF
ncbi:hypothetical protein [Micrococcus luteus]|uniref:hypothetical protein n=1 Tax=Micrococcus luteus TaxID=1270 RepID=UPI00066606DC|nr:hypothetical protein [Micrococcus luteus]